MKDLEEFIDHVRCAKSLTDQKNVFEEAIKNIGFKYYTYNIEKASGAGKHAPVFVTSYPQEWVKHYLKNNYYQIDPLVLGGPRYQLPFLWSDVVQSFTLSQRQTRLYEEAADLGIANGLVVPIHGQDGEYAAINLIPAGSAREQAETLLHHRHCAHLIALYYHAHSGNSLLENYLEQDVPVFSPRETEVLTWIARGKSSWDISKILSISERTVLFHIENAKQKMGVRSRTHLVVKAVMLGLIHP